MLLVEGWLDDTDVDVDVDVDVHEIRTALAMLGYVLSILVLSILVFLYSCIVAPLIDCQWHALAVRCTRSNCIELFRIECTLLLGGMEEDNDDDNGVR